MTHGTEITLKGHPTRCGHSIGVQDLVSDVVQDLLDSGEVVPEPLSHRKYSGKFNLRVGLELNRQLARDASEAGTSLNQHIVR